MKRLVDSTDRGPLDYVNFGAVFWGFILAVAGILMLSAGLALFGLLILACGLAYFVVRNRRSRSS